MSEAPTGFILWTAIAIVWLYYCVVWRSGPVRVFQIWVASFRALYLWLFREGMPGFFDRWPRYRKIRARVLRGDL